MLSKHTQGLFLEINDFSVLAAVTSDLDAPLTIERLEECSVSEGPEEIKEFLADLIETKGRRHIPARCGVYPQSRFLRRTTLDNPNKAREPSFFAEMLNNQFRIDTEKNAVFSINALNGSDFDPEGNLQNQKEILFCGAEFRELRKAQGVITNYNVYPDRLEIGTLATMGGLMNYTQLKKQKSPTLVLEITPESAYIIIIRDGSLDIVRPIPYGLNSMFPVVQSELALKDEASARKLFYSNTFDFTELGPSLLRKMMKELQASTGFYEVQTGQTIGQIFLSLLPENLNWIQSTLAKSLGVKVLKVDYSQWLNAMEISTGDAIQVESLGNRWLGLFSLMGKY